MSPFTIAPLSSRILQRFPGNKPLEAHATDSVVISEAEDQPMRPAIFPSGELDLIKGVHKFSAGLEDELHLTIRDKVHHTATTAWRLRNVYLAGGQLCNHHSYKRLTFGKLPFLPARVEPVDETVAFCSTDAGNDYFAHFLLDDAATALLGRDFGRTIFGGAPQPRTQQMLEYMKFFEVPYQEKSQAWFRDLWLFTDYPQNRNRRERLRQLKSLLRKKFKDKQSPTPAYIRRGKSGSQRYLENETEIESQLAARGFKIIDPEVMNADEICQQLNNSPLVVGVEGSQLAHGLLNLHSGGGLLCIQPADHFNAVYRGFCNSLDLNWGFVVAEGIATRCRLPVRRLLYMVDQMLEKTEPSC